MAATTMAAVPIAPNAAHADSIRNQQWYLKELRIEEAHTLSTGSGVVVAVVDSGSYPHRDLKNNLLQGIDETKGGTGNGQSDDVGHGTAMAALIAAHGSTGSRGVLGIAPSAKILPVRASNAGSNSESIYARGIAWADNKGAQVISVSAGGGPNPALIRAVEAALEDDIVVVAAAGNTSSEVLIGYPASIDGVLTVGATGRDGKYSPRSLKNSRVQICAPGTDIITARPDNKYSTTNGTSTSAAIVSGAAALVRAKFPQLSATDVVNRLTSTADDIGPPGRDDECGFGRLNLIDALAANVPPLQGAGSPEPSESRSAGTSTAPAPTPTGNAAAPNTDPAGSNSPILFGALAAILGAGSVLAYFLLRRRRSP